MQRCQGQTNAFYLVTDVLARWTGLKNRAFVNLRVLAITPLGAKEVELDISLFESFTDKVHLADTGRAAQVAHQDNLEAGELFVLVLLPEDVEGDNDAVDPVPLHPRALYMLPQ